MTQPMDSDALQQTLRDVEQASAAAIASEDEKRREMSNRKWNQRLAVLVGVVYLISFLLPSFEEHKNPVFFNSVHSSMTGGPPPKIDEAPPELIVKYWPSQPLVRGVTGFGFFDLLIFLALVFLLSGLRLLSWLVSLIACFVYMWQELNLVGAGYPSGLRLLSGYYVWFASGAQLMFGNVGLMTMSFIGWIMYSFRRKPRLG